MDSVTGPGPGGTNRAPRLRCVRAVIDAAPRSFPQQLSFMWRDAARPSGSDVARERVTHLGGRGQDREEDVQLLGSKVRHRETLKGEVLEQGDPLRSFTHVHALLLHRGV